MRTQVRILRKSRCRDQEDKEELKTRTSEVVRKGTFKEFVCLFLKESSPGINELCELVGEPLFSLSVEGPLKENESLGNLSWV